MMWYRLLLLLFVGLLESECRPEEHSYPPVRRGPPVLPPYMLNLYNRLKEDRVLPHGTANTIRSFVPVAGNLGERELMVFNISGVHPSEYIERSELHLRWIKESSLQKFWKSKKRILRLVLMNLNKQSELQISPSIRRSGWGGWHTLDVTDAVIAGLDDDNQDDYLIGVAIQGDDDDDDDHDDDDDLNDDDNKNGHSDIHDVFATAFLVLFSEDDDHLTIKEMRTNETESSSRGKRGLLDNELPDNFFKTSKGAETKARLKHQPLEAAKQTKKKKKRRQNKSKDHQSMELKWRKNWWKTGKQDGDEGDEEDIIETGVTHSNYGSICQRNSFIIDFAKVGWSDWIIAPKRYEAYVCSGDCSFAHQKETQLSNYATLQNLFWQNSEGEAPVFCCVPQALSAVPLLFYDQNRNVVLKKFPAMKVQSCTCR